MCSIYGKRLYYQGFNLANKFRTVQVLHCPTLPLSYCPTTLITTRRLEKCQELYQEEAAVAAVHRSNNLLIMVAEKPLAIW